MEPSSARPSRLATGVTFRTADFVLALDLKAGQSGVHAVVRTLRGLGVTTHTDWVRRIEAFPAPVADESPEEDGRPVAEEGPEQTRGWTEYSLVDLLFLATMHRLHGVLGPMQFAGVRAMLRVRELSARGKIAGQGAVSFEGWLDRLFYEGREPYFAIADAEAVPVTAMEAVSREIPMRAVLSDNPAVLREMVAKRLFPLGGAMHVLSLRSIVQPAVERLRSRSKHGDAIPVLPAYVPPVEPLLELTAEEHRLVSLLRNATNLNPDISLRMHEQRLREIEYRQSFSAGGGFSPAKALAAEDAVSVTSNRSDDGGIRNYVVTKRVVFDA